MENGQEDLTEHKNQKTPSWAIKRAVHGELLVAENQLGLLANLLYRFSMKDYLDGNPVEMMLGASFVVDDIKARLNRITRSEVTEDIEIPEGGAA